MAQPKDRTQHIRLIGRSQAGWWAAFHTDDSIGSISGATSPDDLARTLTAAQNYGEPRTSEGALIFDADQIPYDLAVSLALGSPMYDVRAPPGHARTYLTHPRVYQPLAQVRPGPLDYVAPDVLVSIYRLHGARCGMVYNGQIVWEDSDAAL